MTAPTQIQQAKFGKPTASRQILMLQNASESVFKQHSVQFLTPINKFNKASSNDSMSKAGMEFFVPAVPVLVNISKQDQAPAWF
jgi:hypothetical protein